MQNLWYNESTVDIIKGKRAGAGKAMEKIFIKTGKPFQSEYSEYAPAHLFRRRFVLERVGKAELAVCGLGYGYYYLNGQEVSKDLFTAPVSDYDKILWCNRYDVSHLLRVGENVFAAALGNGFFNESFPSNWGNNLARWRDHAKLFMALFQENLLWNISYLIFRKSS